MADNTEKTLCLTQLRLISIPTQLQREAILDIDQPVPLVEKLTSCRLITKEDAWKAQMAIAQCTTWSVVWIDGDILQPIAAGGPDWKPWPGSNRPTHCCFQLTGSPGFTTWTTQQAYAAEAGVHSSAFGTEPGIAKTGAHRKTMRVPAISSSSPTKSFGWFEIGACYKRIEETKRIWEIF
jgi:hypothetical protein